MKERKLFHPIVAVFIMGAVLYTSFPEEFLPVRTAGRRKTDHGDWTDETMNL